MGLTHKSQSALEYMMTYGWAILVIVIVAAVLYSLGIFSPSSSLSTTITGFSQLGVTSAECYSGYGLAFSFTDNTGNPINLTGINVTSNSGVQNLSLDYVVLSGGTSELFVPNACPAGTGARFSDSITITYTEPGAVFPGPYISTGAIAGSSSAYTNSNAYGWAYGTFTSEPSSEWGVNETNPNGTGIAYDGDSTYGLITNSNFPQSLNSLNQVNLNKSDTCGTDESGPHGYTAIATLYVPSKTINISAWVDDNEEIYYKPVSSSTWTEAAGFGCCHLDTANVSITPGMYNFMVDWYNACEGGTSSTFLKPAFIEYSPEWAVTTWIGYSFSTTLVSPGTTPSGDTVVNTGELSGNWP